jgi:hypothetical protein
MPNLTIEAAIARVEKAIKAEKDPDKLAALYADLGAYKKTKTHIEKHETEEGDPDSDDSDDSDDDSDSDSDDEDSEGDDAAAKGDETVRTDAAEDDDEGEADEDDSEDEESEEDEAASYDEEEDAAAKSAALNVMAAAGAAGVSAPAARKAIRQAVRVAVKKALSESRGTRVYQAARKVTGKRSVAGIEAALRGMATGYKDAKAQLAQAHKDARKAQRSTLVAQALQERRISPAEAKTLRKSSLSFVEKTLAMKTSPIVFPADGDSGGPTAAGLGPATMFGTGQLNAEQKGIVDALVSAAKQRGVDLDPKKIAEDAVKNAAKGVGTTWTRSAPTSRNGRVI